MFKFNNISVLSTRESNKGNQMIIASFEFNGYHFGFDGELNAGKPENLTRFLKYLNNYATEVVSNSHNSKMLMKYGIPAAKPKLDATTLCDIYSKCGNEGKIISSNFFKYM